MGNMPSLPTNVKEQIDTIVEAARTAFGSDLVSVVLYGSAAEGRLRASSDVNMLMVLKRFRKEGVDQIRDPFRTAHAAVQLDIMFLLESEIVQAAEAFAVKFDDIFTRHCILFGVDPFGNHEIPRDAAIRRLKQIILNLRLRLRERYALVSLREEQLAPVIAEFASPLRACASSILKLEGHPASSPKEALHTIVTGMNDARWQSVLAMISEAREQQIIPAGAGGPVIFQLLELTGILEERVMRLTTQG